MSGLGWFPRQKIVENTRFLLTPNPWYYRREPNPTYRRTEKVSENRVEKMPQYEHGP